MVLSDAEKKRKSRAKKSANYHAHERETSRKRMALYRAKNKAQKQALRLGGFLSEDDRKMVQEHVAGRKRRLLHDWFERRNLRLDVEKANEAKYLTSFMMKVDLHQIELELAEFEISVIEDIAAVEFFNTLGFQDDGQRLSDKSAGRVDEPTAPSIQDVNKRPVVKRNKKVTARLVKKTTDQLVGKNNKIVRPTTGNNGANAPNPIKVKISNPKKVETPPASPKCASGMDQATTWPPTAPPHRPIQKKTTQSDALSARPTPPFPTTAVQAEEPVSVDTPLMGPFYPAVVRRDLTIPSAADESLPPPPIPEVEALLGMELEDFEVHPRDLLALQEEECAMQALRKKEQAAVAAAAAAAATLQREKAQAAALAAQREREAALAAQRERVALALLREQEAAAALQREQHRREEEVAALSHQVSESMDVDDLLPVYLEDFPVDVRGVVIDAECFGADKFAW